MRCWAFGEDIKVEECYSADYVYCWSMQCSSAADQSSAAECWYCSARIRRDLEEDVLYQVKLFVETVPP